jgi:hypothetical protein
MGAVRMLLAVLCLAFLPVLAANLRLYLKDGGYQVVREYQVQSDRVRFYSVERSEWEEVPLDLARLPRCRWIPASTSSARRN